MKSLYDQRSRRNCQSCNYPGPLYDDLEGGLFKSDAGAGCSDSSSICASWTERVKNWDFTPQQKVRKRCKRHMNVQKKRLKYQKLLAHTMVHLHTGHTKFPWFYWHLNRKTYVLRSKLASNWKNGNASVYALLVYCSPILNYSHPYHCLIHELDSFLIKNE